MSYFIYQLTHDRWDTPWTFIWLTTASLFSIAALLVTIILHCCVGLTSRLNLAVNGFLLVLWAVSWSLLTWFMSPTLANMCDVEHWHEDTGIMICRIYKALFAFTLLGLVSTVAAFALDIYVYRMTTSRGIYKLHDLDHTDGSHAAAGAFTEMEQRRKSEAWEMPRTSWELPRTSMSPYGEQADPGPASHGYALPEAQFKYDTGYSNGRHHMQP